MELAPASVVAVTAPEVPKARRKFSPQLIETAKRSKKAGDLLPALLASDKTNVSPGDVLDRPRPTPLPPTNTPNHTSSNLPTLLKPSPIRQGSIRPHYTTRANTRQHSYKVPGLEDIESDESGEEEEAPSLSRSLSLSSSDEAYKHATRMRESVDDRFSGYLLALAARAAEKQLREQEAAAFATSDYHEPVAHYVDDSENDDISVSEPTTVIVADPTRSDSADERWALRELQRHAEQTRKEMRLVSEEPPTAQPARKRTAGVFNVEFDDDVIQDAWVTPAAPKNLIGGYQRDPDLKQMRKAASPPMLGGDIEFPRCPSPEHARFDVTQGSTFLKTTMCYLTEQGLWGGFEDPAKKQSLWSDKSGAKKDSGGLWGGFCTPKDAKAMQPCAGIMTPIRTPAVERDDPFTQLSSVASIAGPRNVVGAVGGVAPPSPPASTSGGCEVPEIDADLARLVEGQVEAEFGDAFVTQVYNYLSLGYPALARKFDAELSKICRVSVEELRRDDKLADARGYLRLGDDEGALGGNWDNEVYEPVDKESCRRWKALRSYVREWGRQMIHFEKKEGVGTTEDAARAWGMPARKGSWGF